MSTERVVNQCELAESNCKQLSCKLLLVWRGTYHANSVRQRIMCAFKHAFTIWYVAW